MPLDDVGRAEWDRIAPILHREGRLTDVNSPMLAQYCDAYSIYFMAREELSLSVVLNTDLGGVKANPAAAVLDKAAARMVKCLGCFDLATAVAAAPDGFTAFLQRRSSR